jgi:hypothetical protein
LSAPKIVPVVAALAVAALLAVGCSSGSSHSADTGPTTTVPAPAAGSKAVFLTAANSLCKEANARTKLIHDGVPPNPTGQDQAYALDKGTDVIAAAVAQMRKLDQPTGDRANLMLFYQRSQQLVVATHQLADAFRARDQAKITSIETKANTLDDQLTHAADDYGLTACGSGSGQ